MAIYRGTGSASSTSDQATIDEVTQQATNAATSATNAATSEANAITSATSASSSASTATSQASAASTSATQAAISEFNASVFAAAASTSNANAGASATLASSSATAATTARTAAEAAQVAAETAETNAAASESTASTAATTATTKASEASTSATTASTAATTASTAATAAETARDQTLASFDSFDDRYLGSKTVDPTLDNDGDALVGGALYFNSVDEVMKVYTGSQWVAAYADVSGALLAVNNRSDLNNATSARTNLGVGIGTDVQAYSSVLANTTASFTTADETKLDGIEAGATADQTAQEIATAIDADATAEATLKTALGLGTAAYTASTDYATAAQGALADSALQSFTETNDLSSAVTWANVPDANITQTSVTQHQAALSITESQISDLQSYLTSIPDNYVLNTGDAITGDLSFGDNDKAIFGAGSDLQIYHDGSNSQIRDLGTGDLYIQASAAVSFTNTNASETYAVLNENGAVSLYYDNSAKFATTSTGIDVTGTAVTDGLEVTGTSKVQQTKEKMTISATAATGTINYDALTQSVLYYTTDASANWTVNVRGDGSNTLNSMMSIGEALTVVFLVTQGSTAYYNSAFQVDGASVTPKYQGGSAPTEGTASGIDAYTYNIIKTADATFTVLASVADFA